jgi:very-short-patch-repair endonuclease
MTEFLGASQIRSESGYVKQIAAGLRRQATPAEELVWKQLRGKRLRGLRFRRQHVLHGYIVDFYCHEMRLCIELDGAPHLEPVQKTKDAERDFDLKFKGYRVLRMMNEDVIHNIPEFLREILRTATPESPSPPL